MPGRVSVLTGVHGADLARRLPAVNCRGGTDRPTALRRRSDARGHNASLVGPPPRGRSRSTPDRRRSRRAAPSTLMDSSRRRMCAERRRGLLRLRGALFVPPRHVVVSTARRRTKSASARRWPPGTAGRALRQSSDLPATDTRSSGRRARPRRSPPAEKTWESVAPPCRRCRASGGREKTPPGLRRQCQYAGIPQHLDRRVICR